MDIVTYQQTMRLLAKIDRKAKEKQTQKATQEEELTPFQNFLGFIIFMLFTVAIHTIAFYLQ